MSARTSILPRDGTFQQLLGLATAICQQAERAAPRPGPGAKPAFADWALAVLIAIAVAHRKKSKNAQYQFLCAHHSELCARLGLARLPSRSTYYDRYRKAHRLLAVAIRLEGRLAIDRGWARAEAVSVDRSLIAARGRAWGPAQQRRGRRRPPGVDRDATWSYSGYHGWVLGYGYEVVVTAAKRGPVWPLLASVDPAHRREHRSFPEKVPQLPAATRYVLADSGYDSNDLGEAVERDAGGRPTGRRMVCPQQKRHGHGTAPAGRWRETRRRRERRLRRSRRKAFYDSERGQGLYIRRARTVEPFNEWFKSLWELDRGAWHRGLANNRTQILAGVLVYQLLLHCNAVRGQHHGRIKCLLNRL